jgi:hypothetical protein
MKTNDGTYLMIFHILPELQKEMETAKVKI